MAATYTITQIDFETRLQLIACCLATKAYTIAKKLKIGISCTDDIKRLTVANAAFDLLKCYKVDDDESDLDEVNCTTTDQVVQRFEWFQEYCDICFNPDLGYYKQVSETT